MGLKFYNLNQSIRELMLHEIDADVAHNKIYISPRLNVLGRNRYPELLRQAALSFDDFWLAERIRLEGILNLTEGRRTRYGVTIAHVPINAHEMLAEGEFNRYYLRALCLWAIQNHSGELIIYRAKPVDTPRIQSELKIGTTIEPNALLKDLRLNIGVDTALGLPPGPNSGLSAKLADGQLV